jgi:hypothetical protein
MNFLEIKDELNEKVYTEEEYYLFEMATISPKTHNFGIDVKLHIFQPGRKFRLSHGPRVKCFKPNVDGDFSISLDEDESKMFVVGKYDKVLSTRDFNKLFSLIQKYRIPFLNMWYDSYMSSEELMEEINEIDLGKEVERRYK